MFRVMHQSKAGSTGDRLREATRINLSLSALGNVIKALVNGKGGALTVIQLLTF